MFKRLIITLSTLCLLLGAPTVHASPITTLNLDALQLDAKDLTGAAGSRVGWGYSLYNNTDIPLFVNGISAGGTLYGDNGISGLGSFRDDIGYFTNGNSIVVAPGDTAYGSFSTDTGLASFLINTGALAGVSVTGKIYLDYTLDDGSFYDTGILTARYGGKDALASVTVVPEPSTYLLLAIALVAVGVVRKKMSNREV